ncbi:MAG: PQQ-binding-like beta-propeller repeat protein [Bryobacteraceae bacterium]|nr:PQQ-binding-like beta-propeller repeat protein [Bryobacteraceae bacterium]
MRLLLVLACLSTPALAENWPSWRGPAASGVSSETGLPLTWSRTENVAWRVPLSDPGNSTPIVWGGRIFVTMAVKAGDRRTLTCFDRASGKLLWQSGVSYTDADPTHATNPHASASPVTDGERVYVWFGSAGLIAYDFSGKEVWRRDLGKQRHTWGYGTSPVLYGNRLFLNFGPGDRAFLIAVDKDTGRTLWQNDFPAGQGQKFANWNAEDMFGSWATPLMIRHQGKDELLLPLPRKLVSFDPETGKENWSAEGLGDLVYPSAVYADGAVVAISGFGGPTLAVKAGGERLWHLPKSRQQIGTGVVRNGLLFTIDNGGIAQCADLKTGAVVWTERLRGKGETNNLWSSPVLAGDRIYVMNQGGDTFVFRAEPKFELLAANALEERSNSSVVISGGDIILRTHEALWRIAGKQQGRKQ